MRRGFFVGRGGLEPPNPKERIYSPPQLPLCDLPIIQLQLQRYIFFSIHQNNDTFFVKNTSKNASIVIQGSRGVVNKWSPYNKKNSETPATEMSAPTTLLNVMGCLNSHHAGRMMIMGVRAIRVLAMPALVY